jgi:hypothetical protein
VAVQRGSRFGAVVVRDLATVRELERARDAAARVSEVAPAGLRVTGGDPMQHIVPSWQRGPESAPRARAEHHGASTEVCKSELAECRAKLRGLSCHEETAALKRRISELEGALARSDDDLRAAEERCVNATAPVAVHDRVREAASVRAAEEHRLAAQARRETRAGGAAHQTLAKPAEDRGNASNANAQMRADAEARGQGHVVADPIARAIVEMGIIGGDGTKRHDMRGQLFVLCMVLTQIAETKEADYDVSIEKLMRAAMDIRALLAFADGKAPTMGTPFVGAGEIHATLRQVMGGVRDELSEVRQKVTGRLAGLMSPELKHLVSAEDLPLLLPVLAKLDDLLSDRLEHGDRTHALQSARSLQEKYKGTPAGQGLSVLLRLAGDEAPNVAVAPRATTRPAVAMRVLASLQITNSFGASDYRHMPPPPWPDALFAELAQAVARRRKRRRFGHGATRHV